MRKTATDLLFQPLLLPNGISLKNRIVKSAMSDSLGDGQGNPTNTQIRLYERWAEGGAAALIVGEVQGSPGFAEKPGNLLLRADSDLNKFRELAVRGQCNGARLLLQLGHAGAMAHAPISTPKGPSVINVPGLSCSALSIEEIKKLPSEFANTAKLAEELGFAGVQIHAAHGFLLSQFLSPLFNQREDAYGGSIESRMRILIEVVDAVRDAVSSSFTVFVKLNASDQLDGGLEEEDALTVVSALDHSGVDLIDISGGTYFPGAKSVSDSSGVGPYFMEFAKMARETTKKPLMVTGGFKSCEQALKAISSGHADVVGLARALVLDPELPKRWIEHGGIGDPRFPQFESPPEGAITAWYTMRITQLGEDSESDEIGDLKTVVGRYEERDRARVMRWNERFNR